MKRILLIITFLAAAVTSFADDDIFSRPAEQALVVDNANAFTDEQHSALTEKLEAFNRETSTQILIYTTNDLHGYDIADFGQRLGEGWGVGQNGFDNGIVIVYKPKTDYESGRVTIQTGYGIESLIPDARCSWIINYKMIPHFRQNEIYEGIDEAVDACIAMTKGEFQPADQRLEHTAGDIAAIVFFIVFIVVTVLLALKFGKNHYTTPGSSVYRSGTWHSSDWSSGGRSSGGGFSHSSFGGFGGGHFGGGGASGSW